MSLNLAHSLILTAQEHPNRPAVILDDLRLTYAELSEYATRVANMLAAKGVQPGDKVAMMIANSPYFPVIYYGVLLAGATVVPINTLLKAREIRQCLVDSEARVFFVWEGFLEEAVPGARESVPGERFVVVSMPDVMEQPAYGEAFMPLLQGTSAEYHLADTMPDDTAVILFTSGTTGSPKGAELTHFNMFFNAYYVMSKVVCLVPEDVILGVLPLFHSFGQTCVQNAAIMAGATISLVPRFQADKVMEVIHRDRVTHLAMVPTMYHLLLHEEACVGRDLGVVRLAVSGGSALPEPVYRQFEKRFNLPILEGYGLSETSPVASFNAVDRPHKIGSIGVPIWGCEMRLMDEIGNFVEGDEIGEIVVRGHNVMKGYFKRELATRETIVDGWFHTGDLARCDEDGYFFVVDRRKDLIIRSGMNVYPREIEEVLYGHPSVLEAAVVGIPDEIRGEEIKGFIVVKPGSNTSEDNFRSYCLERLAKYKCPKWFEIRGELPKGPTGKILKRVLVRS